MDQNQLAQLLKIYDTEYGGAMNWAPNQSPYTSSAANLQDQIAHGQNARGARLNWAMARMNESVPDFFGQGSGMTPSRPEYVQPQRRDINNPYQERAMQLNNDPYSGQGMQPQIANTLARFLEPAIKKPKQANNSQYAQFIPVPYQGNPNLTSWSR